jgi:hypothetical protein
MLVAGRSRHEQRMTGAYEASGVKAWRDTGRAMSRENAELLRTATDAINSADVEAFVACFHPDVKWEARDEGFPGFGGTYRGDEGMRRWLKQVVEPWESLHLDVEEMSEPRRRDGSRCGFRPAPAHGERCPAWANTRCGRRSSRTPASMTARYSGAHLARRRVSGWLGAWGA